MNFCTSNPPWKFPPKGQARNSQRQVQSQNDTYGDNLTLTFLHFASAALTHANEFLTVLGARLNWREWVTVAWFGPKGFASVFFTLLVLRSGLAAADQLYLLAALVIVALSILHSSTDVLLARWFQLGAHTPNTAD
jgi:NhaP-type Na+/H+ or K+/H+ antiporter